MRVYLCGAINGRPDADRNDWRAAARGGLACATLDPMARDFRGREDDCAAEIVEGDKADIDACTHVLVHYDRPSVGTSMEVLYAWEGGKTVVVVAPEGTRLSPWLAYHSHHVLTDLAAAVALLNRERV